ncbi:MAG: hypothetical protein R3B47_15005 [Bacteroidia bacterium]
MFALEEKSRSAPENFRPVLSVFSEQNDQHIIIASGIMARNSASDHGQDFQPRFFTTKPTGKGNTGLGLSMSCYDIIIVQSHGGSIEVETEPNEYICFIIKLPKNNVG